MNAIIILLIINLLIAQFSVKSAKIIDTTTSGERPPDFLEAKPSVKIHQSYKIFNVNDSSVYLDDVLFALKNQNWSDVEQPCLDRSLLLIRNLQNFTLWAVWDWDAISSEPEGLLYGNRFQLGNFDECMRAPWYQQHPELRTQYCLADIELERTDGNAKKTSDPYNPYESALNVIEYETVLQRPLNKLTWGACVPAVCQPQSVEKLMGVLLAHSHLGAVGLRARIAVKDKCQKADETMPYDSLFYGFVVTATSLVAITLVCTYVNWKNETCKKNSIKHKLITAFDLQTNARKLLNKTDSGTEVLYGIKFLSMCVIVFGHNFGIFHGGPVSNGSKVDEDIISVLGILMLHEDIVVDSFFMISGFLTATALTNLKRLPNLFLVLLKRYTRLVVAYAVVIFYICAVYPHTGSGPLWNYAIAEYTDLCRTNWWQNLLMISNYNSRDMCLLISWYIPCDFHFFVVTILLFSLYKNYPTLGGITVVIVFIAAIVTPGVVNYMYSLPAIQVFNYDFVSNPRGPEQFHVSYVKSHTRYAPYLVGFFSGYIFTLWKSDGNAKKISKKWSIVAATLGLLIMIVILVTGPIILWRSYDALESAIYAALNRPVWAIGLAVLVICCSLGEVPIITGFLSWFPWVPLSQLTYELYLIHTVIISRVIYISRNPVHHDLFNCTTTALGIIVVGTLAALLIKLFAESPILNLINICLMPRVSIQHVKRDTASNHHSDKVNAERNSKTSHLEDNLPTTIHVISSKM